VSNIFRYDLAADSIDILTNAETGFFRPLPLGGDSMVAFRYTGQGFVPTMIHAAPLHDVSAIRFLGNDVVERYPVLKAWKVPSPAAVDLDSLTVYRGPYRWRRRIGLDSMYPVFQGYKDFGAVGWRFNFSDPFAFDNLNLTASYSPTASLPAGERWHVNADYRHFALGARFRYNGTSFYDLVGPTRVSRKGYEYALSYDRLLIRDSPRTLELDALLAGYAQIERLPFYQNVATPSGFTRGFTPSAELHYKFIRSSLGYVDPEKGVEWRLRGTVNSIWLEEPQGLVLRGFPLFSGTFDFGVPLLLPHSSIWSRSAGGYSPGDRTQPFANFYFGGFGNNKLDYQDPKRYRTRVSFPGVPLNDVGGTNFVKTQLDWNLPPLRFEHLGVLDFYATWARLSVFSTAIGTNLDLPSARREVVDVGAQADVRLMLLIQQPLTFSIGYAGAFEHLQPARRELMISLKILG
jgi:hypothetical protein